ncbi:TRAP transporter small permease [Anaeroselena agilis]|uniref:TRAP transporter small permease n=1 Tax=Anaeroselena agilis TaxID=3063788 RepID=A0ABU3P1J7_9FIRM|nr:TRAP transporter small permease [Selenomonadales bacterium 4137-cl]
MPFINKLVTKVEKYCLVFLIIIMTFLGLAQIISRFVIQSPIPWTEALLTYMFVWTCFLGASLAVEQNAHFGVEIFVVMLPKPLQRVIEMAVYLLIIVFAGLMINKGMLFVEGNRDQMMAAMPFSMIWPYLAIPVSGVFIAIHALNAMYRLAVGRN